MPGYRSTLCSRTIINSVQPTSRSPESKPRLFNSDERQRPGTPDRERAFDCGLKVILPVIMELKADQGLSSAGLFAFSYFRGCAQLVSCLRKTIILTLLKQTDCVANLRSHIVTLPFDGGCKRVIAYFMHACQKPFLQRRHLLQVEFIHDRLATHQVGIKA